MREWDWTVGLYAASPIKKEVIHCMAWGPGMITGIDSFVLNWQMQLICLLQDIYLHGVATLAE